MICQSLANQASSSTDAEDCSMLDTLLCPGFNFPVESRSAMSFEEQRRLLDGPISEICCRNPKMTGTDADPFDPQRGLAYRYIGWSLMHKTPKMIEAGASRGMRFATGSRSVVKGNPLCGRPRPPLGPGCGRRVQCREMLVSVERKKTSEPSGHGGTWKQHNASTIEVL